MSLDFFENGTVWDHYGDVILFTSGGSGGPIKPLQTLKPLKELKTDQTLKIHKQFELVFNDPITIN